VCLLVHVNVEQLEEVCCLFKGSKSKGQEAGCGVGGGCCAKGGESEGEGGSR
jgi:hypothetical protein